MGQWHEVRRAYTGYCAGNAVELLRDALCHTLIIRREIATLDTLDFFDLIPVVNSLIIV